MHNSCDIKVCFINLYVHVVNVDLTKPLAKYAGNSPVLLPLYAALQICVILELCVFPGPCNLFDVRQYAHSIHFFSEKYLG